MEEFRQREIHKIWKLKVAVISFLLLINFSIIAFFGYSFHSVYISRNLQQNNFLNYVLPTLLYTQLVLSIFFGPLIYITHKKTSVFIKLLRSLDVENLLIHQNYTKVVQRIFAIIAPYVFTQNGLIISTTLSYKTVNYYEIISVSYKLLPYVGKNPYKHQLLITAHQKLHNFLFFQKISAQFAIDQLLIKNPNIRLSKKDF